MQPDNTAGRTPSAPYTGIMESKMDTTITVYLRADAVPPTPKTRTQCGSNEGFTRSDLDGNGVVVAPESSVGW